MTTSRLGFLRSAWHLRIYALAALAVAVVIAIVASLVIYGQRQNRQDARRDADEATLRSAISRITIDEASITSLVDQNRNAINNNSAQVGSNQLDISDLREIVAQTKAEVIRQLDGIANVGPPTTADTVSAKLVAILQRIDRLEARLAKLEAASESPTQATPSGVPSPTPTARMERSPRPSPSPHAAERCVVPHTVVCSGAQP